MAQATQQQIDATVAKGLRDFQYNQLEPGDVVVHRTSFGHVTGKYSLLVVERVTATQVIANGKRYTIRRGEEIGEKYHADQIWPCSAVWLTRIAEIEKEKLHKELVRTVQDIAWANLDVDQLQQVIALAVSFK